MSKKPIFVATHPRACSTAFERVFMTRSDTLTCAHEPFGDAFYFGPERLSERYENNEKAREESGFSNSTFKTVVERLERDGAEGKRLFIKDIVHYIIPPEGKEASIAPSLVVKPNKSVRTNGFVERNGMCNGTSNGASKRMNNGETNGTSTRTRTSNGTSEWLRNGATNGASNGASNGLKPSPYPYNTDPEPGNPTVIPEEILRRFHFTFLIRHPRSSIPSYYRCTVPPLDAFTGFYNFMPSEAGYSELRRLFDYLKSKKHIGPARAGQYSGPLDNGEVSITVVDADDLLDNPSGIIEAFCKEVGLDYDPSMLTWDTEEDQRKARDAFEKWNGFHNEAIESSSLKTRPRTYEKKTKTTESEDNEWLEKYGEKGQKIIRDCVTQNILDYEYLRSFAMKI